MSQFFFEKNFKFVDRDHEAFKSSASKCESEFTELVRLMRDSSKFPVSLVNELMGLFWDLVGNKIVLSVIANVDALMFYAEVQSKKSVAAVICPANWHERIILDPYYQMGGLVYSASKAKDYWNLKEPDHERALSYEAEVLSYFSKFAPAYKPTEYQKKVVERYPGGVRDNLTHYKSRPFSFAHCPPYPYQQ